MKILILQLARLGDIYLSWPALRALRRQFPTAQIEVLTRGRYMAALEGCEAVSKVRLFDTTKILTPMVTADADIQAAFQLTNECITELRAENYDWVVNLSFSPLGSYVAHAVAGENTRVTGYSRFSDGYLSIPDDMSAYFYAQVGPGKPNRFHLAEIFGTMFDADLIPEDWAPPKFLKALNGPRQGIVIHVGASEQKKLISPAKWAAIINQICKARKDEITLIGAKHERAIAENILASVSSTQVRSFVGDTTLSQVFELLQGAGLLIGCDSAPIHMASLVQTPTLNISLPTVNFWETGPRAAKSFVLRANSEDDLPSDRVSELVNKILKSEPLDLGLAVGISGTPSYRVLLPRDQEFQWKLVRAMYRGEEFPESPDDGFYQSVDKLADVNSLMVEQMEFIARGGELQKVSGIIDRGEEIIEAISKLAPNISPLVRWYQTEKLRIGPGESEQVLTKTLEIHRLLGKALALYQAPVIEATENL
jgi:ADP-heptose:LPS heptosyltransferase